MARLASLLAVLVLFGLVGCSDKKPTALVVGVTSEAASPADLDSVTIQAVRGGETKFSQSYALDGRSVLPGTLVFQNGADEAPSQSIELIITGKLAGKDRVVRKARLGFVTERTKLLRLRLEYACFGKLDCADGTTCIGGSCSGEDLDPNQLGDFNDNSDVVPPPKAASSPATCFDAAMCLGAADRHSVALPLMGCSFMAPAPAGKFNVGMTWAVAPTHPVVVENDATDGFSVKDGQVILSGGLCTALAQGGAALDLFVSTACDTKSPGAPICVGSDAIASGGHGGSGGSGGEGGAGNGGGGNGGTSGNAGSSGKGGGSGGAGNGGGGNGGAGHGGGGNGGSGGNAGVGGGVGGTGGAGGGMGGSGGAGGDLGGSAGAGGDMGGSAGAGGDMGGSAGAGGDMGGAGGGGGNAGTAGTGTATMGGSGGVAGAGGSGGNSGGGNGGSAGNSGSGGISGGGGNGGSSAGNGGASGGGGCSNNQPPIANIAPPGQADVGGTISLDGASSSDPEMGALTYLWTPLGGAPAPASPNATSTQVTFPDCGSFTYQLTVTDACGTPSTGAKLTIVVAANGPYVAAEACNPGHQCGTVASPYCTIQTGVASVKGPKLMIAGVAQTPYSGEVDLTKPLVLEGGYEKTFAQARNTDPATNGCVLETSTASGIVAQLTGAATIDGFMLRALDAPASAVRSLVSVNSGAQVTIQNVAMDDGESVPFNGDAFGIYLQGTAAASSVTLTDVAAVGPNATGNSAAVAIVASSTASFSTLGGCTLAGGPAPQSYGVFAQSGAVNMKGDIVTTHDAGSSSIAISLNAMAADVTLDTVTTSPGSASTSIGVDFANTAASLNLTSCTLTSNVSAQGISAAARIATTGFVQVQGGDYRGSGGTGSTGQTWGFLVTQSGGTNFNNSTISGGDSGDQRVAIEAPPPLTAFTNTIRGSDTKGGTTTIGIHMSGTSHASGTIGSNLEISGGDPVSDPAGNSYVARGILVDIGAMTMNNNTIVRGCINGCEGDGMVGTPSAIGIYVNTHDEAQIYSSTILGGEHIGSGTTAVHYGVYNDVQNGFHYLSGNTITASPSPTNRVAVAIGLYVQDSVFFTGSNTIQGGYATQTVMGGKIFGTVLRPQYESGVDVFLGGDAPSATGLFLDHLDMAVAINSAIYRDVMDACGYAACPSIVTGVGVHLFNTKSAEIVDSYAFGGPGDSSIGCELGGDASSPPGVFSFNDNFCLATSHAGAGTVALGVSLYQSMQTLALVGNIFSGGPFAAQRFGVFEQAGVNNKSIGYNLFLPDAGVTGAGVAYYRVQNGAELDSQVSINSAPGFSSTNNVVPLPFVNADPTLPTAAGYHLDKANCPPKYGQQNPDVTVDFDGQNRPVSTDVGPDECL